LLPRAFLPLEYFSNCTGLAAVDVPEFRCYADPILFGAKSR
jgi:hypothetical protein